jgi:hypothetical protein
MVQRGLRQLHLLAPGVLGVGQHDPALFAHRLQARVDGGRGAEFLARHHVAHRQPLALARGARHPGEDAFLQRVERGQ